MDLKATKGLKWQFWRDILRKFQWISFKNRKWRILLQMEFTSDKKNYCSTKKINQNKEKEYLWNSSNKEWRDSHSPCCSELLAALLDLMVCQNKRYGWIQACKINLADEHTSDKHKRVWSHHGSGSVKESSALKTILCFHLLLTWNTRSKLLWELWYQIVVNSVLHGSQDYDRSGIINCRENQNYSNYLLCPLTLIANCR